MKKNRPFFEVFSSKALQAVYHFFAPLFFVLNMADMHVLERESEI
jgi:hypothetical protein